jgi:hypothetical protein
LHVYDHYNQGSEKVKGKFYESTLLARENDLRVDSVSDPEIQEPMEVYEWLNVAYKTFRDKEDGCIKVVLKPSGL